MRTMNLPVRMVFCGFTSFQLQLLLTTLLENMWLWVINTLSLTFIFLITVEKSEGSYLGCRMSCLGLMFCAYGKQCSKLSKSCLCTILQFFLCFLCKCFNKHSVKKQLSITVREVSRSNPGNLPLLQACRECGWLPCWPLYSQQVLHQRWISGIHGMQVTKHGKRGIHPGFETQGRHHQKSKTGVSVAPQKELVSSKNF